MFLKDILAHFEANTDHSSLVLLQTLRSIIQSNANLPHSGCGKTLQRWQIFSKVAATNLSLAKWYESHCDALSILAELKIQEPPKGVYAVWAAEGSVRPIQCHLNICSGEKLWCSGADLVEYGLVTYKNENAETQLCIVDMKAEGIEIDHSKWQAIGMKDTGTATLRFSNVLVRNVGEPNDYLSRVGFWHGAAGVAACWFGATSRIASILEKEFQRKSTAFTALYFGEVSANLKISKTLFEVVAKKIDQQPMLTHELDIRILRFQVEQTAKKVIELVGNALGARPFCENAIFAELVADLPVFLRQSHAAYDLEKIAHLSVLQSDSTDGEYKDSCVWML